MSVTPFFSQSTVSYKATGPGGCKFLGIKLGTGTLNVTMDGQDGHKWAAYVIGIRTPQQSIVHDMQLDANGFGTISIPWAEADSFLWVSVVLDTALNATPADLSISVSDDARVGVKFTNKVHGANKGGSLLLDNADTVVSDQYRPLNSGSTHNVRTLNERFIADSIYKHHDWKGSSAKFKMIDSFQVPTQPLEQTANFISLSPVTIRNELIGAPSLSGGTLKFRDPWYLYSSGTQSDSFFTYNLSNGPFRPTGAYNKDTGGVFLNQGDTTYLQLPYYSVRAESTQTIGGFSAKFVGWNATGANLVQVGSNTPGYNEKAVIFRSTNAVVKALYHAVVTNNFIDSWNLVSLPVVQSDNRKTTLWPTAVSDAFAYQGSTYATKDTIQNGLGYWIKYNGASIISYAGPFIGLDTIPVTSSWNMIGSITDSISKGRIKSIPSNNINSEFFKWENNGYAIDSVILPGKGYWVKVFNDGNLILDATSQITSPNQTYTQDPPLAPGAPGKPRLLSPDSGGVNKPISLTFSWYQVEEATSYRFQLSTSSTFNTLIVDDATITTNSKSVSSLSYSTTYYWCVRAANADVYGNWSNVWRFTTTTAPPEPPPAPMLLSPSNGSTGRDISLYLSWNPSSTATSYWLQVSRYSNFNPLIIDYPNLTETSEWISSLSFSTKYYWRVNATNSNGTSDWSSVWNFTTKSTSPPNPCPEYTAYPQMDAIVVSDSSGNRQTLYMRNRGFSVGHGISGNEEMPPEPPPGLFHARFSSGKFLESIPPGQGKKILPLHIRDAVYPLSISWNIKETNATNYRLHVPGEGKPVEILMVGTGSTTIYKQDNGNNVIHVESESTQPCDPMETKSARVESEENVLSSSPTPKEFALLPNIPNPFNPTTEIRYQIPEDVHVTLKVYDVLGQEIATLVNEVQSAGYKTITFDGTNLSAGMYFYQLRAGSFSNTKKFLLIK